MIEALSHLLGAVCGQNPVHTWGPGGILLPCCQRCTGLYVGAAVATLLHLWLQPRLTGRFLEIHGAFLLLMGPFGLHWVPQGPILRAGSGVLFGFAVVTFLWLPLSSRFAFRAGPSAARKYFLVLAAALALLPLVAAVGGTFVAYLLSGATACGAAALLALVMADVGCGVIGALRWTRRRMTWRLPA
jgi:hypothetical protein